MDQQLKILIDYYEEEKINLQRMIKECLEEDDYLFAHHHSKALERVMRRLRTFKNFSDKFYDEKLRSIEIIERLKENLNTDLDLPEYRYNSIKKWIVQENEKLQKLNAQKEDKIEVQQELDIAFNKLVSKKIKRFKLILNNTDNFYLSFRYVKKQIEIIIPNVKRLFIDRHLNLVVMPNVFREIGFSLSIDSRKFILFSPYNEYSDWGLLKNKLSRIVFEFYYFKNFERESFIQYSE